MKKETSKMLWIGLIVLILVGGGIWAYSAAQAPTANQTADPKLLTNSGSHSSETGTRVYPVTIVEFGDYECPACAYAEPIIEKILTDDPQVKLIFRNFPLQQHPYALLAAEAAEAAGAQGKFWEMHNTIYANQDLWVKMQNPMDAFTEIAKRLNLDMDKFTSDVNNNKYADLISKDRQDGVALGVNSTPTFYINGRQYLGGLDYNTIQLAIQQAMRDGTTQQTSTTTTSGSNRTDQTSSATPTAGSTAQSQQ